MQSTVFLFARKGYEQFRKEKKCTAVDNLRHTRTTNDRIDMETGMERTFFTRKDAPIGSDYNNEYQYDDMLEILEAQAAEDIRRAARSVRELSGCRLRLKMSANRTNNIANELDDLGRALSVKRNAYRK